MSGTPLCRAELKTAVTGGETDVALAGRGTAPRHAPIEYAAFAALACSIVIASLVAAPGRSGLFGGALGLLMLAVAVADARAFIIPDKLTIAAFLLALTNAANEGLASMPENIAVAALRGLVLAVAFFALREIYLRLRHRHGIGLGDVKLAAVAGAWLDWTLIPVAIEIAALTALIIYVASHFVRRRPLCAAAKLPFGLFFAPAIWFCWLLNAIFFEV
jgi:leader peptidase (prepilin peptidase) / N-methyltransferase